MKPVYLILIAAFAFSIITTGCKKKNEEPQKPTNNISKIIQDYYGDCEIKYNKNGYPVLVTYTYTDGRASSLDIIYNNNKIEKLTLIKKEKLGNETKNYFVSYPTENQVNLLDNDKKNILLIFNNDLLTEVRNIKSPGVVDYKEKYFYNADSNLDKLEYYPYGDLRNIDKHVDFYSDYDTNPNPLFSKAKTWGILMAIYGVGVRELMPRPISRNNPKLVSMIFPNASNFLKGVFEYNKNYLPVGLSQSFYQIFYINYDAPPLENRPLPNPNEYKLLSYKTKIYYLGQ